MRGNGKEGKKKNIIVDVKVVDSRKGATIATGLLTSFSVAELPRRRQERKGEKQ